MCEGLAVLRCHDVHIACATLYMARARCICEALTRWSDLVVESLQRRHFAVTFGADAVPLASIGKQLEHVLFKQRRHSIFTVHDTVRDGL